MDTESAANTSICGFDMPSPYEYVGARWNFTSFVILGAILKYQGSVEEKLQGGIFCKGRDVPWRATQGILQCLVVQSYQ